jgi:lactococcin 972 family bacteriocin
MKNSLKPLVAVAAAGAIILGGAGTAAAVTENVGGGTWTHYVADKNVSNYYHQNVKHSATAVNNVGSSTSGQVAKGVWANSWVYASAWGNKAYWNTY